MCLLSIFYTTFIGYYLFDIKQEITYIMFVLVSAENIN